MPRLSSERVAQQSIITQDPLWGYIGLVNILNYEYPYDQGQKVEGFDKDMHHHFLPEKGIPKQMNVDASSVRIGHNFWIVGGSKECSTFGTFGNFG